MNDDYIFCGFGRSSISLADAKQVKDYSLEELSEKISDLTHKQNMITHWNLSKEVETLVIIELQEQKNLIKEQMHNKVNSL